MKSRIETRQSVRKKSEKIMAARARRRRAAMSAAACVVLAFSTAGAFWLNGRQWAANSMYGLPKMETAPLTQSDYETGSEITYGGAEASGADNLREGDEVKGTGPIYTARNSIYTEADSVRVYTRPASKEVSLCAEDSKQEEFIVRLSNWISDLKTNEVSGSKDNSDIVYVIERSYGENLTAVYVKGNRIKFDKGQWLGFSDGDREEFENIIGEIFDAD